MGVWGMGMSQSDEFQEIYESFMERYDAGEAADDISAAILGKYLAEFDDKDGVMHDVYFALAKAMWMCCAPSPQIFARVKAIIEGGENLAFYRELGATPADLKRRKATLEKFWQTLQTPRPAPRKRRPPPRTRPAELAKGTVFWYRSQSVVYGGIILEKLAQGHLVALSQPLQKVPHSSDDVLDAPAYTVFWQKALLPEDRIHPVGQITIAACYENRAGLYIGQGVIFLENEGSQAHWQHQSCPISFSGECLRDLLAADRIPNRIVHTKKLSEFIAQAQANAARKNLPHTGYTLFVTNSYSVWIRR